MFVRLALSTISFSCAFVSVFFLSCISIKLQIREVLSATVKLIFFFCYLCIFAFPFRHSSLSLFEIRPHLKLSSSFTRLFCVLCLFVCLFSSCLPFRYIVFQLPDNHFLFLLVILFFRHAAREYACSFPFIG